MDHSDPSTVEFIDEMFVDDEIDHNPPGMMREAVTEQFGMEAGAT